MKGQLELLINNLGKTYHDLVKLGLIEKNSIRESQYEDSDSLEIESISGIELVFEPIAYRFEAIYIRLRNDAYSELPTYPAPLPKSLCEIHERYDSHKIFGKPISSTEANHTAGIPAADIYQLDTNLHPAAQLSLQYGTSKNLNVIAISLLDASV
ncbi:DUF6392 family protein [Pseudomonas rubra]|uniref:DUF6392 family protein n=1 Tax=Pseudomonas rubra TaxID=2942627 RepID=A0ABT5P3F4_9PSED|nr:DUF6392 family protein [Pseudomonas rubra]MDD1012775.1 DUF6392 family protein [Pseudomonas rubra]MDD1037064.1 DUF6392 family protein [Pseudomonas rubra]MDD1156966.1 DUF6392 family protein [Pseudomonas rubra]